MVNSRNLKELTLAGYEYIVSIQLKYSKKVSALLLRCEEFLAQFHLPSKQDKTKDPVKIRLRIDRFLRRKRAKAFFHYSLDSSSKLTYHRLKEQIVREALLDDLFISGDQGLY